MSEASPPQADSVAGSPRPAEADPPPEANAFGRAYWMLNGIEMFERLAYFGIRAVVPLYIMQATEPGGLHLTAVHKGWIYMWWAVLQSWLPMFTGGLADRYGYKRTLCAAITTNALGYVLMAYLHSYYGFLLGVLVLATGTAFFKPSLQGSLAQNLTKENSSMGWGIFYWVVNVGAFGAPFVSTLVLGKPHSAEGWQNLFLLCAAFTSVNLLLLLTFKDVPSGADKTRSLGEVFGMTVENIWPYWFVGGRIHRPRLAAGLLLAVAGLVVVIMEPLGIGGWRELTIGLGILFVGGCLATWLSGGRFQWQLRLPAFLLIMSCFWMMMYQLWDLQPNFIEDWIDSSMVAAVVPLDFLKEYGTKGLVQVPQQILLNLNAGLIILLILPISWLVRRMRTLSAMLIGMGVATAGVLVAGLTGNGWVLLLGILFFSLGEMLTGPKKNQYLGLIAPPGKKGLYLGYVNIPIGVGVGLGSMIAGFVYDYYGEKATLALKEVSANQALLARAARCSDWSHSLDKVVELTGIERDKAFALAARREDGGAAAVMAHFRFDEGQIVNLALQFLALDAQRRPAVAEALEVPVSEATVARHVDRLPQALGVHRSETLDVLRDHLAAGGQEVPSDADLVVMLWQRFGEDPQTRANLGLEYLAQSTELLEQAVRELTFESPADAVRARIDEIADRVGLRRTESFEALSAALGAGPEEIEAALQSLDMPQASRADRLYAYLMTQEHRRFIAVGRKHWTRDVQLLRRIAESDAAARQAAARRTPDLDYAALAEDSGAVQQVLSQVAWTGIPELAAQILRLNPAEAESQVSADVEDSLFRTTRMLWAKYDPQYHVWIPFAAIGVAAMAALAVFGQMAKRWADMNA